MALRPCYQGCPVEEVETSVRECLDGMKHVRQLNCHTVYTWYYYPWDVTHLESTRSVKPATQFPHQYETFKRATSEAGARPTERRSSRPTSPGCRVSAGAWARV